MRCKLGEVCMWAKWPIKPETILVSVAWSDYSPLDRMLVHHRATPSNKFTGAHLFIRTRRNVPRLCSTQTKPSLSSDKCTNHDATMPFMRQGSERIGNSGVWCMKQQALLLHLLHEAGIMPKRGQNKWVDELLWTVFLPPLDGWGRHRMERLDEVLVQ